MIIGFLTINDSINKIKTLSSFNNKLKNLIESNSLLVIFNFSFYQYDFSQYIQENLSLLNHWDKIINCKIITEKENVYIPYIIQKIILEKLSEKINLAQFQYFISNSDTVFSEVIPFISHKFNGSTISLVENIITSNQNNEIMFSTTNFGGKLISTIKPLKKPVFITIKSFNNNSQIQNNNNMNIDEIEIKLTEEYYDIEIIETKKEETEIKLEEAKIIISGGRGLGSKEGFDLLKELAQLLGAAIGASRAAVDSGWIEPQYQIGQTGKTVSPELYIAVGISGASQHIAGINKSKYIVSINTDPEAPIIKYSHFAIIEDYKVFIKDFINVLKQSK